MRKNKYMQSLNGWVTKDILKSKICERKLRNVLTYGSKTLCVCMCVLSLSTYGSPTFYLLGQTTDDASISSQVTINYMSKYTTDSLEVPDIKGENEESVLTQEDVIINDVILESEIVEVENAPLVAEPQMEYEITSTHKVPNWDRRCRSNAFSYMAYTATTDRTSAQYKLLNSDRADTDETTGIRVIDGRYAIAVGTGWGFKIGDYIDVVMENGSVIPCIMGEAKANDDTDSKHQFHLSDGSVVEMVIDNNYFHATSQYPEQLKGIVLELQGVNPIRN